MNGLRRQTSLVAYRTFSDVAGKGAFLLVTMLAARRLSRDGFGVFSLGTTVGWIAAVASDFGIQLFLARSVAQEPSHAGPLLERWLRVRIWTSAVALSLVAIALVLGRMPWEAGRAIFLLAFAYVVSGLVEFLHYLYRGLSRSDLESTLTLGQRGLTLICAVAVLWWRPSVTGLGVAMLGPSLATFVWSIRRAKRLAGETPELLAPPAPRSSLNRSSDILPIGLGILLSALYFRIDVFLIQGWNGTVAVGLYNAVFRLVEALRLLPAAVLAVALPVLFRATSRRPLVTLSALLTGGAIFVTTILWLSAEPVVILLYGERYADAIPAFRVLLLSFPLMSLNYALTLQLIGWHGHREYAALCGLALVVNVALNAQMLPTQGILGAAWATLATEALLTIGCVIVLMRSTDAASLSHLSNELAVPR